MFVSLLRFSFFRLVLGLSLPHFLISITGLVTALPSSVLDPVLFLFPSVVGSLSGLAGARVPSSALASTQAVHLLEKLWLAHR
ncbi:hypothetical protein HD554DRAFT_271507 [Boletus coccyginus]|nr:hypothetical protein HD554DRAFT_271507 [Boletus coccyginus]